MWLIMLHPWQLKLEQCGVRETPFNWFKSCQHPKKQVCKIKHAVSDKVEIHCGFPQGSNFDPLIVNCLQTTKASMFADETNLSCKGKTSANIEYKLNCDLDKIQK